MVVALLLAASLAAPGIAASGLVDAPEGFRARLPARFRYATDAQNGFTYYRAADPAGTAMVSVAMGEAEAALECQQTGEQEARPGIRTRVTPLRTRGGLDGCVVLSRNDKGALALAMLLAPDGRAVVIAGVAQGPDRAERLARDVAESVTVKPLPPVDPRVVGCFARESSRTQDAFVADYFTVTKRLERCFFADRRYRGNTEVLMTGRANGASGDPREGRWSSGAGKLSVAGPDESWTESLGFQGDDLVLDGKLWSREASSEGEDE